MVHESKVANTKEAENPFDQSNWHQSSRLQELVPSLSRIPFDHVTLLARQISGCQLSVSILHTKKRRRRF